MNSYFLTFIIVLLHTGTNFPAVNVNSLLDVAMMKTRQRWNGTGDPTRSQPQAASLTLSAWNKAMLFYIHNTRVKCVHLDSCWGKFIHYLLALSVEFQASKIQTRWKVARSSTTPELVTRPWKLPNSTKVITLILLIWFGHVA